MSNRKKEIDKELCSINDAMKILNAKYLALQSELLNILRDEQQK